ncbi:hypothetical protein [Terriglobus albidus]|uniref:hypothetical protein n=1 Tax=Terriglobus albidus TaxID=1592106 RepID=UPI0021E03D9E|nr:hypothetical protein [Terriglobus albidus]
MLTAAILWQSQLAQDHSNLLITFIAVVAAAVVVQAGVLIAMAIGVSKAQKQLLGIAQELQAKAIPIMDSVTSAVEKTAPKVDRITDNLVETTNILRDKAHELDIVVSEAATRARAQVVRVDTAMTDSLNTVGRVTAEVHHAIMVPVRHISGVMHGIKAGLETLVGRAKAWKSTAASVATGVGDTEE